MKKSKPSSPSTGTSAARSRAAKAAVKLVPKPAVARAAKPAVAPAAKLAVASAVKPAVVRDVKAAVPTAGKPAVVRAPRPATPRAAKPASPVAKRASTASALMPLHDGIIYGPVRSRRLGRSLGVNLTPALVKLCSFNCAYCQYGWSEMSRTSTQTALANWPSPAVVAKAVSGALRACAAQGDRIDRLTLAGHGEPTMHPEFKQVVAALQKVRHDLAPKVPIAILSNASTLDRADVRQGLALIDERYMKLDAGDAAVMRKVNGTSLSVDHIVEGLCQLKDVTIQSMFVRDRSGRLDNTGDLAVINWVVALQRVKPKAVQIYTLDRAPAFPYLQAVPAPRLREIAQRVRLAGIPCEVFGIPEAEPVLLMSSAAAVAR